ncbi:hypothetical protein BH23CHL2_BH23CHL2_19080 [soil metagenome]
MTSSDDSRIVHVGTAPNETIAMMWRDILRDEGIAAVVKGGGSGYGLGHNLLNEQYILVREDQAALAREILEELEDEDIPIIWETS